MTDERPTIIAVHVSDKHVFSKGARNAIKLVENHGVEGDCHAGPIDQHRFHLRRFGESPNLRQVHLIQTELFEELSGKGHTVRPGDLGENVSTRNVDLLSLPTGTRLRLGPEAVIELTGLRNPCIQIETFQPGLLKHVVETTPTGAFVRKGGVMSVVLHGGIVRPGDPIGVELPPLPHELLMYRPPGIEVSITCIRREANGINSLELRTPDNSTLPAFTAGAHIDLLLGPNLRRSYSICNDPHEQDRYILSVNNDPNSRGGSRHVHEKVRVGDRFQIAPPANSFELDETADYTVLIAGGIGITPLKSMIHRLNRLGRSWELFYAAKSCATTAFLAELQQLESEKPGRVHLHFSAKSQGNRMNLNAIVAAAAKSTHFYCCGPLSMITSFNEATAKLPRSQVHTEYFAGRGQAATEGGFKLRLHRSEQTLEVPSGKTVLETLLAAGVAMPYSCREGVCGACKVKVLEGVPDHRDVVLTSEERSRNDQMTVCCSGSKRQLLVLDL